MAGWFTSRINASVVPAAPVAEPLGIGETVSALGRTAGGILDQNRQTEIQTDKIATAIAEREKARQQDKNNGETGVAVQQSEGAFERYYTDVRNDPDAYSKIDARIEADKSELRAKLGNDQDLINHWDPIFEKMAQSRRTQAYQYIAAARAQAGAMVGKQALTLAMDNAAVHPERTEDFADAETTRILGDSTIQAELRPALAEEHARQVRLSGAVAMARSGRYDALANEIEAGTFAGKLPEGGLETLQRVIDAERGSAEVAARAAAADRERSAREAIAQVNVAIKNGEDVPVSTLQAVVANAKAAGLPQSELMEAGYLGEKMVYAQRAKAASPEQLSAQIATLRARRAAGGAQQLKPAEMRMLEQLEAERDGRDGKDGDSLSALWKQGAQGQMAALARLTQMPLDQRERVTAKMGQEHLAIVAGLRPETQQMALIGLQVRAARKDDYLPPKRANDTGEEQLKRAFDAIIGPAVKNGLAGQYKAMMDAASDIYVGAQASRGATGGWERAGFEKAVKIAFGATRRADGTWQGGLGEVRGRQVELPNRWNESEVDQYISRYDFARAGAVYGTNAAVSNADVTANYQPVFDHQDADGAAYYRFEDRRGGALIDRKAKRVFLLPFADRGAR